MQKPLFFQLIYRFHQLFWSIYFVITIALIGFLFGNVLTLSILLLAMILSPWPKLSEKIRHFGELVQCLSIRGLLRIQPWLRCQEELPPIIGFFDQYRTRKIVFVGNHRSNLDTFFMISYIPGLRGLAKDTLFRNLFFAPYMLIVGFIPIKRQSMESLCNGLRQLKNKILLRNRSVLLFPETTRCEKNFPSVGKFGAFFFDVAMESEALIVPFVLHGTDQIMGRGDLLIHPFQPIKIQLLAPIEAATFKNSRVLRDHVWNQIKVSHDEV